MVYLHLFKDVAAKLNGFLIKFQTYSPMVPFLSEELGDILRWLMRFFIQKSVLKKAKNAKQLAEVDVMDDSNIKLKTCIKLTTSGAIALEKTPSKLHEGLKNSWVSFLKSIISKIQERSSLTKKLVLSAASLDPLMMAHVDIESLLSMFEGITDVMLKNNRLSHKESESAKDQFEKIVKKVVSCNKEQFINFNFKTSRVDEFLSFYVATKSYPQFWKVCKFVFTLTHGQSSVEHGFNINKQTMVDNLQHVSLSSLRMIYDEIQVHGSVKEFPITNKLMLSCKSASRKYKEEQEKKNKSEKESNENNKRKLLNEEMLIVKKKKTETESVMKKLHEESDSFLLKADKADNVSEIKELVSKASSFKHLLKTRIKTLRVMKKQFYK